MPFLFKKNFFLYFFKLSILSSEKEVTDNSHYGNIPQMEMYTIVDVSKSNIQMISFDETVSSMEEKEIGTYCV